MRGCAGAGARELRCSVVNHKALISLSVAFGGAASLARPSSAPPPCEVTQGHVGKENSSDRIVQDATIFFPTRVRRPLCIGLPPHAGALACSCSIGCAGARAPVPRQKETRPPRVSCGALQALCKASALQTAACKQQAPAGLPAGRPA